MSQIIPLKIRSQQNRQIYLRQKRNLALGSVLSLIVMTVFLNRTLNHYRIQNAVDNNIMTNRSLASLPQSQLKIKDENWEYNLAKKLSLQTLPSKSTKDVLLSPVEMGVIQTLNSKYLIQMKQGKVVNIQAISPNEQNLIKVSQEDFLKQTINLYSNEPRVIKKVSQNVFELHALNPQDGILKANFIMQQNQIVSLEIKE